MASPSLTLSTLFVSPKLITEHFIRSSSAVKGPHCCTGKSELKTRCRVPWGSPDRAWRSSSTISQWTPQLKDPQITQHLPRKGSPVLLAGLCLPCEQEVGSDSPTGDHGKPQGPDRDFAQKQVKGCGLSWAPFFWGDSGSLHFIPLSHCLQWHLWALHPTPLSFVLGTDFCSFTYFVGSEGIPHDHLPILNESREKEKLRPSRDVAASQLGKTLLLISSPQTAMSFCLHFNNSTVVTVKHQGDASQ